MMLRVAVSNSYLFHVTCCHVPRLRYLAPSFWETDDDAAETSGCIRSRSMICE